MIKTFSRIFVTGLIVALVGQKTTIVNAGATPIYVVDTDTMDAMQTLNAGEQKAVLKAMYAIEPGKAKSLSAGTYCVDLGESFQNLAILVVEKAAPKQSPAPPAPQPQIAPNPSDPANPSDTDNSSDPDNPAPNSGDTSQPAN